MKNISILSALLIFVSIKTFSQTYDEHILAANELYAEEEYVESSEFWDKAFLIHTGYASDYYNAACTNALAGNSAKAFRQLEAAVLNGWEDIEWMKKDSDLNSLKKSGDWNDFMAHVPEFLKSYQARLNLPLKEQLEQLRVQDQTIRLLLPDAEARFGRDSEEYGWFRNELMPRNDSIVLESVIALIDQEGWLGISEVGELANQTLWLVIQHAPLAIQETYLPLLENSVSKGESKASYLAFLEDRILMRKKEPQIYGTQSLWDKEKMKNVIWPIWDSADVNQRRREVGLETIEAYAKKSGFVYEPKSDN